MRRQTAISITATLALAAVSMCPPVRRASRSLEQTLTTKALAAGMLAYSHFATPPVTPPATPTIPPGEDIDVVLDSAPSGYTLVLPKDVGDLDIHNACLFSERGNQLGYAIVFGKGGGTMANEDFDNNRTVKYAEGDVVLVFEGYGIRAVTYKPKKYYPNRFDIGLDGDYVRDDFPLGSLNSYVNARLPLMQRLRDACTPDRTIK